MNDNVAVYLLEFELGENDYSNQQLFHHKYWQANVVSHQNLWTFLFPYITL